MRVNRTHRKFFQQCVCHEEQDTPCCDVPEGCGCATLLEDERRANTQWKEATGEEESPVGSLGAITGRKGISPVLDEG